MKPAHDNKEVLFCLDDFRVDFPQVSAVRGMTLTVHRGETLGIVGESGSGKSVTWLAALGLLGRSVKITGKADFDGRSLLSLPEKERARLRGTRIAMIPQDPMSALNPVHRVGRQVEEVLRLHLGMTTREARAETQRLLDLVGIPAAARRIDFYPHELSGGQNQRVMIAMALAGQPDLLIADEPTTALDVTLQAQILTLLEDLQHEYGMALVLISHDFAVVGEVCERIAVVHAGRVVETAPALTLLSAPSHSYTRKLLASIPQFVVSSGITSLASPNRFLEERPFAFVCVEKSHATP